MHFFPIRFRTNTMRCIPNILVFRKNWLRLIVCKHYIYMHARDMVSVLKVNANTFRLHWFQLLVFMTIICLIDQVEVYSERIAEGMKELDDMETDDNKE